MRWWHSLKFPHLRAALGKESIQLDTIGFDNLFHGTDPNAQDRAGFKALVILERHADQIGSLLLAQSRLASELA